MAFITQAFKHGSTSIAVFQECDAKGDKFKICKKAINYVRGKNVESYRVMDSASTFTDLRECMAKFERLVNAQRKIDGKEPVKFTVED